jgi:hypothetical protein
MSELSLEADMLGAGTLIDRPTGPFLCQEKASQSFDRDESTMFRVPKSDTRCRRTLFIHGYQEPYFVK